MYNQTSIPNPKSFIKTTTIIHLALLAGQVVFGVAVFFITPNPIIDLKPGNDPFFYISPALVVMGIFLGTFLFKKQLEKVAEKTSLQEKLPVYQSALIMRAAMSEGASLFGIVCMMLTANLFYLLIVGINILYFIWIRPTKFKIEEDLKLDYDEKAALES